MSKTAKKVLLILAGILVCVLTYFFVYSPNADEIDALEAETSQFQSEVNRLTALQAIVTEQQPLADQHEAEMDMYFAEYPSKMTEQKAIYNVYRMMVDTGMRVTALQPSKDLTFMQGGALVGTEDAVLTENMEEAEGAGASAEAAPETKVPVNEIIGKYSSYTLAVLGKKSEIMAALDWISSNSEHMAVGPLALSYDAGTGKLSGTITVNYYSMNGNGIAYVEPDVSDIIIGSEDIFGTGEKKKDKDKGKRTYQEPGAPIVNENLGDEDENVGD